MAGYGYSMSLAAQAARLGNATVDTRKDGTPKPGKPSGKRVIPAHVDRLTRKERKAQCEGRNIASVGSATVPVPAQVGCTGGQVKGDCQPTAHAWAERKTQAKTTVVRTGGREARKQALADAAANLSAKQHKDIAERKHTELLTKKTCKKLKKLLEHAEENWQD